MGDTDSVEGGEDSMNDGGDYWWEGLSDIHDALDDEDEHGEDGDDDVEVCDTGNR